MKNWKETLFPIVCTMSIIGILSMYCWFKTIESDTKKLADINLELTNERADKTTCRYKSDSLTKVVEELSVYKALSVAMVHRDEATYQLKYRVGDIVRLKNDSSKVVIEDVVIGGSKFNYYVKYKVLTKDNTSKELVPELIY